MELIKVLYLITSIQYAQNSFKHMWAFFGYDNVLN